MGLFRKMVKAELGRCYDRHMIESHYVVCIMLFVGELRRPGSDLLSHALRRSTIGAEGFHGRVRDGIGC